MCSNTPTQLLDCLNDWLETVLKTAGTDDKDLDQSHQRFYQHVLAKLPNKEQKTMVNHLIKTIVHVVGECVITKHFMCLRENRERQAFLPILDKNIPHYSLDKEFTNELVDRANLKSKVPQMFGTNF